MEKKSFIIAELLCFFFGWLGIHRFYTGYIGLGILQLITFGGCGIWSFFDFMFISLGKFKDASGQELAEYDSRVGYGALIFVLAVGILNGLRIVVTTTSFIHNIQ